MRTYNSTATATSEYRPTIIDTGLLVARLAIEIKFLKNELKRGWVEMRRDPVDFGSRVTQELFGGLKQLLWTPNLIPACLTAILAVASMVMIVHLVDSTRLKEPTQLGVSNGLPSELVMLDVTGSPNSHRDPGMGQDGNGRVGFQKNKGEGSGAEPKRSQGGGGGGELDSMPPQVGKLPPSSTILAAIPKTPPLNPPTLPVAGIDIDPALWNDLKAPVYGDPRSTSEVPSKGPGDGGGIGTDKGLGIGNGSGPGFGPGIDGNMGGGPKQTGCCGPGGGSRYDTNGQDHPFSGREVEQRARLLSKPEPQYTEEARRNQITGTVMLRVVFSSLGEVIQIRAVRTLPFGLTERAIAAARQIKFLPATKGGRPVSVYMQLEYNFDLY